MNYSPKITYVFVLICIMLMISGCGGSGTTNTPLSTNSAPSPPPATPTPVSLDLTMGQTGQADGWKITLVSVKLDMDYQVQADLNVDDNHHVLNSVSLNRVPVIVCHLRITNIGTQPAHISATSDATVFSLYNQPFVSGESGHGVVTPYVQANVIDTDVAVGATIEGDAAYRPYVDQEPGPGDAFTLVYDASDGFGNLIRWHFTV